MLEKWADRRLGIGWWKQDGGCRFGIDIRDEGDMQNGRSVQDLDPSHHVKDKRARVNVSED